MDGEFRDTAEEVTLAEVKKRTVSGIIFLTLRTFLLQAIGFVGTLVLLPAFLQRGEFGVFIIVSSVINFLQYFSDIGLAAALIQKKENLTDEDLKTTFTVQQSLVLAAILAVFISTPLIRSWQKLDEQSVFLLWALALSFFLSSLKTIPSVLLERKLAFGKLVIPQIVETLLFNITAVFLAWRGFGVMSFTIAVIARGVVGLIIMYILQPWKPALGFDKQAFRKLIRFGVPYQANTFLAVFKDDGMTLVLGGILGREAIGLLGWAQRWAFAPLRFFMDQVIKATFPAYSRMQDNSEELRHALSKSIFFISFLVFPSLIGLVVLAPIAIKIVPRYAQWQPALLALSLFSINAGWAAVTTPLTNLLNSIGKIRITFYLMIMWTVLTWILTPYMAINYGLNGVALASAMIGSSSVVAIIVARKFVEFDVLNSCVKPLLAALAMGIVLLVVRGMQDASFYWAVILVVFGALVYIVGNIFLLGGQVIEDVKKVKNVVFKKA